MRCFPWSKLFFDVAVLLWAISDLSQKHNQLSLSAPFSDTYRTARTLDHASFIVHSAPSSITLSYRTPRKSIFLSASRAMHTRSPSGSDSTACFNPYRLRRHHADSCREGIAECRTGLDRTGNEGRAGGHRAGRSHEYRHIHHTHAGDESSHGPHRRARHQSREARTPRRRCRTRGDEEMRR